MNVLAISRLGLVFVAEGRRVSVSHLSFDSTISAPFKTLPSPASINAIRIGTIGSEEVLGTVDDQGEVRIYYPNNLDSKPICFSNVISTWGLAFGGQSFFMAVSSNSHNITLMDTKNHTFGNQGTLRSLRGHNHNVPCVDFSPCGKFLVSASIDETCTLWDTSTGRAIKSAKVSQEWGWGVRFVDEASFKFVPEEQAEHLHKGQLMLMKIRNDSGLSPFTFSTFHTPSVEILRQYLAGEIDLEGLEHFPDSEDEEDLDLYDHDMDYEDGEFEGEDDGDEEEEEEEHEEVGEAEENNGGNHSSTAESPMPASSSSAIPSSSQSHTPPFVIFTSQHHLFLLDSQLKTLAELKNPIALPLSAANSELFGIDRLSLMNYIPEYSLLILASQGTGKAILIRIVRTTSIGKPVYHLIPEEIVPGFNLSRPSALAGMDTRKNYVKGLLTSVDLILLYQNGFHVTCEISQKADQPLESVDTLLI